MGKFGTLPQRAPESFGVVGLLGDRCKIYYDSIFSARHIGRVSDLLMALLKDAGTDELRLRIILMFSLYEGYRCQLEALSRPEGESLPEPLVIECGLDAEKFAVGVAFNYGSSEIPDLEAFSQKVQSGGASSRLEKFIAQVAADSDRAVVRIQPESRRIEIVSLVGLPGRIDGAELAERRPIELYILRPDSKASTLKATYVELGDLDYNRLLSEDRPGAPNERPATGEILAQGAEEAETVARIEGEKEAKERLTKISGVTQHMSSDQEELRIKKASKVAAGDTAVASGNGETGDEDDLLTDPTSENSEEALETARKKVVLYKTRLAQLQTKIQTLEEKRQKETVLVRDAGAGPAADALEAEREALNKRGAKLTDMIRNFFKRKKTDEDAIAERERELSRAEAETQAQSQAAEENEEPIDPEANEILREQVTHLEEIIEKMRREALAMKNENGSSRAQKWAENAVGELIAEKARVNDMARKLAISFRQKEHELKTRESLLREEIKRKDEQVRQKSSALERAKEQVSQMTMTLERSKGQQHASGEEGQLRQKLSFTQKLLQGAKDENSALARKIDELKNQLMSAQSASATKPRTAGEADAASMKIKYERLLKQNEEFKRANQLLMEKVNETQKPRTGTMSAEEMKSKLEMAMRLAANYQKDAESQRLKIEELQREEARLKGELNRSNNALRALKASAAAHGKRTGNDDPNGSKAA